MLSAALAACGAPKLPDPSIGSAAPPAALMAPPQNMQTIPDNQL